MAERLRPTLTLIEGGGKTTSPHKDHLRLVEDSEEFRHWLAEGIAFAADSPLWFRNHPTPRGEVN